MQLLGVCDGTRLADDCNLDLARIRHFVLYLCGDVSAQLLSLLIVDLVGTNDDTQFSACLDSVCLDHARVAHSDVFQVLEALDVSLHNLTTSTRTCTADGVADLNDGGQQCGHLHFVVVSTDSVAYLGLLLVLLSQLGSIKSVWQFGLLVGHLADVMQQASTLCLLRVESQFTCHDGAEVGCFASVLQEVLSVTAAILHLAYDANQFGMQSVYAQVDGGALAYLEDFLVDLLLDLRHNLLDASGMYASVGHKLVQSQAANLASNGVEGADDDGFG